MCCLSLFACVVCVACCMLCVYVFRVCGGCVCSFDVGCALIVFSLIVVCCVGCVVLLF